MQHPTGTKIQYQSNKDARPRPNFQPGSNSSTAKSTQHIIPRIIIPQNRIILGTHQQDNKRRENPYGPDECRNMPRYRKTPIVQAPNEGSRKSKMDRGTIMRNKIEVGLQETTTVNLNARIRERRTPQVPGPHPHQTTALTPSVDGTKVCIHSAPAGTP